MFVASGSSANISFPLPRRWKRPKVKRSPGKFQGQISRHQGHFHCKVRTDRPQILLCSMAVAQSTVAPCLMQLVILSLVYPCSNNIGSYLAQVWVGYGIALALISLESSLPSSSPSSLRQLAAAHPNPRQVYHALDIMTGLARNGDLELGTRGKGGKDIRARNALLLTATCKHWRVISEESGITPHYSSVPSTNCMLPRSSTLGYHSLILQAELVNS